MFEKNLLEHLDTFSKLNILESNLNSIARVCAIALERGNKIMFCGNGGSAADAQHLAAELTGRFIKDRCPLAGLSLTTDTSALTCISNDYSYEDIFVRQVQGLGKTGDVLIGISTSGNSPNVVKAVDMANLMDIDTVGFLGNNGGKLGSMVKYGLHVPSNITARIQEAHIFLGHTLIGLIEDELYARHII